MLKMAEQEKKIYVGSGKEITFSSGGTMLKVSLSRENLDVLYNNLSDKGYVAICVAKRRENDKFGNTHSVTLDTWKPDPNYKAGDKAPASSNQQQQPAPQANIPIYNQKQANPPQRQQPSAPPTEDDDIPF
jgi:hypothetical protein